MEIKKKRRPNIFEESLFDHVQRMHQPSYFLENDYDHYHIFLNTGIEHHREPDFVEFNYSYFDEKSPMLEYLLTRVITQNLIEGKIGMLFDISFIDNMGTFDKYKYLRSLDSYLRIQTPNCDDLLSEIEKRTTVLRNSSASDYCLSLLQLKEKIRQGLWCKYLFIDGSNSFETNQKKLHTKKEGTIGRRYSYSGKAKHGDIQTRVIEIVNFMQVNRQMRVFDFQLDHYGHEKLIYIENGRVCISRKLLAKIQYKTQMCHIVSFYLLNATYAKFIAEFFELRKMTAEPKPGIFGAVKAISGEQVEFMLVIFQIEDFSLTILRMESLKYADIVM